MRDLYQTSNYANLLPQNSLQLAAQPQPTIVNAFRQNLEIDPLDPDQVIATPEKVPLNVMTAVRALQVELLGQETSPIDFLRGGAVKRASGGSQTTRKSSFGLGYVQKSAETQQPTSATVAHFQSCSHRSGNENVTTLQITNGKTNIDCETKLDCNYEIQFLHVSKTI
ncbi:MAG: hypothetical protein EZS28_048930 [Streblomastix strix]|uniref:Uncharacterized protein n=1 Tax=Streblomastix strix TaxID=222440 RepID=A0A5J4TCN5_9EUKA|nr:MAG: hypothetical protein EZS28_048930 [Streblomastix strix]